MNYLKIYNDLIKSRKSLNRKRGDGNYYEQHHILPLCFGGKTTKSNLVLLTAKEHFIAHLLLTKCYTGKVRRQKMLYALTMMGRKVVGKRLLSAGQYNTIKQTIAQLNSERCKGLKLSEEHKRNIGNGVRGIKRSEEFKQAVSRGNKGKKRTEEQKKNMKGVVGFMKGHKKSTKLKNKIRIAKLNYYKTHEHVCKKKIGDRGDTSGWVDDYVNSNLSIYDIAKKYNIFYRQLIKEVRLHNIPLRSQLKIKKGKNLKHESTRI